MRRRPLLNPPPHRWIRFIHRLSLLACMLLSLGTTLLVLLSLAVMMGMEPAVSGPLSLLHGLPMPLRLTMMPISGGAVVFNLSMNALLILPLMNGLQNRDAPHAPPNGTWETVLNQVMVSALGLLSLMVAPQLHSF